MKTGDINNMSTIKKNEKANLLILMKFGPKENLEKLQSGNIYMKNLGYYIGLEKGTKDEHVGDMYDGLWPLRDVKLKIFEENSEDLIVELQGPIATFNFGLDRQPVFCMFAFDYRNYISEYSNSDQTFIRYEFSDEQKNNLINFGESVLIIKDNREFFS